MEPYRESSILPLPSGDAGVALTVSHLRRLVLDAQTSQLAHAAVQEALVSTPEKNPGAEAAALLGWLRERYRYLQDPVEVELVRDPRYLLRQIERQGFFMGDCDDAAVLLATLLETAGYPTRFIVQGESGESFSHVLVETELRPGQWVAADLTNRRAVLGWKPSGVGREAQERRAGMLGQDELSFAGDPDVSAALTTEKQANLWAGGAGQNGSATEDFLSRLFSKETLQQALAVAERVGFYKPVIGYDVQGRPIYGSAIPLSGQQAAYASVTQMAGGLPLWAWALLGVGAVVVFSLRR